MYAKYQNSVSQELIWVLIWNFQRMLKGEEHLIKLQFVHTTANTTVTAAFTTAAATTTSLILLVRLRTLRGKFDNIQVIKRTYQQCHSNG